MSAFEVFLTQTETDPAKQARQFLEEAKEAFDVDLHAMRERHQKLGMSEGLSRDIQWLCWRSFLDNEKVQAASEALSKRRDRWQWGKLNRSYGERI